MKRIERVAPGTPYDHRMEELPRIVEEFGLQEVFDHLASHALVKERHLPIPENTALFYCDFEFVFPADTQKTIFLSISAEHGVFYDFVARFAEPRTHPRQPEELFSDQVPDDLRAMAFVDSAGRLVGVYYPSRNVLVASDWSHWGCVSDFERFWEAVRPYIARVEPRPRPEKSRHRYRITVGADPEFELVDPMDGVIPACEVVDGDTTTPIGLDGAADQVELRPDPGSPEDVVRSLRELLAEFSRRYPEYDLSPLGDTFPLGCHIHIGVDGKSFEPPSNLIEMLDDFIGRPLSRLNGEARGGYAQLGAWRTQPHGFEYRTPPAASVADPEVARIVFKAAYNLVDLYLNKEDPIEYETPPTIEDYVRIAGLTEDEARRFLEYCDREPTPSLLAAWGLPAPEPPRARISRQDDWADEVINDLRGEILGGLKREGLICTKRIVLYGLHKDRGFVSNIPIEGMGLLENPPYALRHRNTLWIGLPRVVRVSWRDYLSWRDKIVAGIMRAIEPFCRKEEE